VVRSFLSARAEVIVPTRSKERAAEFRGVLGSAADEHLHLVQHDYTSFRGAEELVDQVVRFRGGLDSVVAPIGGWWQGGTLAEVSPEDWNSAFVGLATAHMAVLRATLPYLPGAGAYTVVVGDSSIWPVPHSGLVSMEQAAVLMMQRVAAAEAGPSRRIFSLTLGPVTTRSAQGTIDAEEVGRVAVAIASSSSPSRALALHNADETREALANLAANTIRTP